MELRRQIRRQMKAMIGPIIGLVLAGYFAYHLVEGDRGLLAWGRLSDELQVAQQRAAVSRDAREAEARRVYQMRAEHLDPDLLDERARAALNLVGPGEVVVLDPAAESPTPTH